MGFNTADGRAEFTALSEQVDFDFVFKIYTDENIIAWLTPVGQSADSSADLLTLGVDYTVSINGDNGGVFTLNIPASNGDNVTLVRSLSPTRNTEYQNNGDLRPNILNLDQDYQTYLIADGVLSINKALRAPENDTLLNLVLPATVAGQYLRVKSDGTKFEYVDLDTEVSESNASASSAANSASSAANSASSAANSASSAANSASSAANSEVIAEHLSQGAFLINETAYDLGFVSDTFNLFPTDLGGLV